MNTRSSRFVTATVLVTALFVMLPTTLHAEELGRLFLTKQERQKLEQLRHEKPEPVTTQPVVELEPFPIIDEVEVPEEEPPEIGGITLRGLVHRKGGNSTAWINSGNTYEGDIGNQYIAVDPDRIEDKNVNVRIPYSGTSVKIRVGQTYVPADESVKDMVDISGK